MLILNHYFEKAALGFPAGGWVLGREASCVCVRMCVCMHVCVHICALGMLGPRKADLVRSVSLCLLAGLVQNDLDSAVLQGCRPEPPMGYVDRGLSVCHAGYYPHYPTIWGGESHSRFSAETQEGKIPIRHPARCEPRQPDPTHPSSSSWHLLTLPRAVCYSHWRP